MNQTTLYEKYGGMETLTKVVHEFYKKVLADPELAGYFHDIQMDQLMQHQVSFLGFVLGGPNNYEGRDLKRAHTTLNVTDQHFGLVAEHLEEVLDETGVSEDDISIILSIVGSVKDQIVQQ